MTQNRNYINQYSQNNDTKKYVCVRAYFNTDGIISPEMVIWEDGRRFPIDRVTEIRAAASFKGGGCGVRYTCRIKDKETYLYLDGSKWFVERKK